MFSFIKKFFKTKKKIKVKPFIFPIQYSDNYEVVPSPKINKKFILLNKNTMRAVDLKAISKVHGKRFEWDVDHDMWYMDCAGSKHEIHLIALSMGLKHKKRKLG